MSFEISTFRTLVELRLIGIREIICKSVVRSLLEPSQFLYNSEVPVAFRYLGARLLKVNR